MVFSYIVGLPAPLGGTQTSFDRRQKFGYWWHPAAKLKSKLIKALEKEAFCIDV